jgi:hypothetical protein
MTKVSKGQSSSFLQAPCDVVGNYSLRLSSLKELSPNVSGECDNGFTTPSWTDGCSNRSYNIRITETRTLTKAKILILSRARMIGLQGAGGEAGN